MKTSNKYSLATTNYKLSKVEWSRISKDVKEHELTSTQVTKKYKLEDEEDNILVYRRLWFLYDVLLQEKYNHLYKRRNISKAVEGMNVYCDYNGYGRGAIVKLLSGNMMLVKFKSRELNTICSSRLMITIHDDIKRKITRL